MRAQARAIGGGAWGGGGGSSLVWEMRQKSARLHFHSTQRIPWNGAPWPESLSRGVCRSAFHLWRLSRCSLEAKRGKAVCQGRRPSISAYVSIFSSASDSRTWHGGTCTRRYMYRVSCTRTVLILCTTTVLVLCTTTVLVLYEYSIGVVVACSHTDRHRSTNVENEIKNEKKP